MAKLIFNKSDRIGIIGGGLAPYFNEAMANQMYLLSKKNNVQVLTCNDIGLKMFDKMGKYFIVNTKFILNKTPLLSLINGIVLYFAIKLFERKTDVIIVAGGIDSEFLNYLDLKKCIPIVTSIPVINDDLKKKIEKYSPKLLGIIAQSKRVKQLLVHMGVSLEKICLMYPLVDFKRYQYFEPPKINTFGVLFASAPNIETIDGNNFEDKGVPLLLDSFKKFIIENDATLYILWRTKYNKELYQKINELNLNDYVEVIDEIVDMPEMYAKIHLTVIPFLNLRRSPEIPLSAIESLACGRPVLVTNVAEISEIVKKYKCGEVSNPIVDDFFIALTNCKRNYNIYQKNCKTVIDELFHENTGEITK